jgi:hypothetical protein
MNSEVFEQRGYGARFEWGPTGAARAARATGSVAQAIRSCDHRAGTR